MPHFSIKKFLFALIFLISFAISFPFLLYGFIFLRFQSRTYHQASTVPTQPTALVLGASVYQDGTTSPILHDRVEAAVELYKQGKVKKLLMSGDNRIPKYNEPEAMKRLAIDLGVPENDIQPDYAGRRTYDSCWRAKHVFSQTEIVVVTQSFHLSRALFLCNHLGTKAVGLTSDQTRYPLSQWAVWQFRDVVALLNAFADIYILPPQVVKGPPIEL